MKNSQGINNNNNNNNNNYWDAQNSLELWDTNGSSNLGQTTIPSDGKQKKEDLMNCGVCSHRKPQRKIEESEKKNL